MPDPIEFSLPANGDEHIRKQMHLRRGEGPDEKEALSRQIWNNYRVGTTIGPFPRLEPPANPTNKHLPHLAIIEDGEIQDTKSGVTLHGMGTYGRHGGDHLQRGP